MSPDTQAIITALSQAREHQGLTLQAISTKSGIPKGNLSRILSGKKAWNGDTITKVARALGLRIEVTGHRSTRKAVTIPLDAAHHSPKRRTPKDTLASRNSPLAGSR